MLNIPYDPILHDLSIIPRNMSAAEIVEYWLDIFDTKDVTEWYDDLRMIVIKNNKLWFYLDLSSLFHLNLPSF